jgi:hypothetical protein
MNYARAVVHWNSWRGRKPEPRTVTLLLHVSRTWYLIKYMHNFTSICTLNSYDTAIKGTGPGIPQFLYSSDVEVKKNRTVLLQSILTETQRVTRLAVIFRWYPPDDKLQTVVRVAAMLCSTKMLHSVCVCVCVYYFEICHHTFSNNRAEKNHDNIPSPLPSLAHCSGRVLKWEPSEYDARSTIHSAATSRSLLKPAALGCRQTSRFEILCT